MGKPKSAFVMMPFASEFDDVYQSLIRDPLIAAGYEVLRCDDLLNQVNILQDIVGSIARSSLLIADLSTSNPNVYYELGLAHALQRPVILFAQTIDEVPFDLRSYRIIQYATHFAKMNEAIATFSSLLNGINEGSVSFGSPISDFGALDSPIKTTSGTRGGPASTTESHELGLLDFRAAVEEGAEVITSIVAEVGNRLNKLNPDITSTGERLSSGGTTSTKAQRNLMRTLALSIDSEATWLRSSNTQYKKAIEEMSNALNSMLSGEFVVEDEGEESLREFIDTLKNSECQATTARDQFTTLAVTIDSLPRIEKEFGRASRLYSAEIKEFVGNIDQTISVFTRARNAASLLVSEI